LGAGCSRSAEEDEDEAGGGTAWADVTEVLGGGQRSLVRGGMMVGAVSEGGGRQLMARGGRTQRRGAWGVAEAVGEGLERWSVTAQRWWVWWRSER
jgi:hypothetical protein